jgi:hypothetical protein
VRELENAIERAVVLGATGLIIPEDLPEAVWMLWRFRGGLVDTTTESERKRNARSWRRLAEPAAAIRKPQNCSAFIQTICTGWSAIST